LQIDHVVPFAHGGSSTQSQNLRLLCPQHNRLAADNIFGTGFMLAAEKKSRAAKKSGQKDSHNREIDPKKHNLRRDYI
jgi:hypothetical protein